VCQILVHAPWLTLCAADGDSCLLGVIEKIVAASKSLVEFGETPWGNDLDGGLEGVECEFEADLIVSLSSTAVGDSNASFLLCNFDLGPGDYGAGEGCSCLTPVRCVLELKGVQFTKKINILVDGIALNSWEAQLFNELSSEIFNIARESPNLQRLCFCSLEVLYALTISYILNIPFKNMVIVPSCPTSAMKQTTCNCQLMYHSTCDS
jgi:hypothetical protein